MGRSIGPATIAMIGFVALYVSFTASAQSGSSTVDAYRPAPRARDGFAVSSADVDADRRLSAGLVLDYANDPLVYETNQGSASSETARIVHHHLVAHAFFTYALLDRLQLYVGLPIDLVQRGQGGVPSGVAAADGPGLGDTWLGLRARIVGNEHFAIAAQLSLVTPTARLADRDQHYRGERTFSLRPTVMGHVDVGILRFALNLGAVIRNDEAFLGLVRRDELTYGLGAIVRLRDGSVQLHGEVFGSTSFRGFADRESTPFEGLVGAKYFHGSGMFVGGSIGMGFVRGFGAPDLRSLLAIGFRSPETEAAPEPEPEPEPVVPGDRDGDGMTDDVDACPDAPEDLDRFEDDNGCPDPDNDQDSVLDVADGAPLDPEDHDDFEDADGVPDPDNDQDGVLDASDRCPLVAGLVEDEGCPPPDRDQDTVIDRADNCPDEFGTVENHGCRAQQQVEIRGDRLEILDNVYFRTNRDVIETRSFALLDNVAAVILAHPEIQRIRVEGHTDARGSRARNLRLSQARAAAVARYLTAHGVAADRLDPRGFGPDRPIVPNAATPEDHARNRRVEFRIEDALGVESRDGGPGADTIDR